MDSTKIAKQMISFQKTVFDNSFNALSVVQAQTETMINNFVGQLPWVNEDSKKQMDEIFKYTKKAQEDFKNTIDEGYSQFDKLLDQK